MLVNVLVIVKCVEVDGIVVDFASIGIFVDVGLSDVDLRYLEVGSVLCYVLYLIMFMDEIEVCVFMMDMFCVFLFKGLRVVLYSYMFACDVTIEEFVA